MTAPTRQTDPTSPDPSPSAATRPAAPPRPKQVQCLDSRGLHRIAHRERGDAANPRVLVQPDPLRAVQEFLRAP